MFNLLANIKQLLSLSKKVRQSIFPTCANQRGGLPVDGDLDILLSIRYAGKPTRATQKVHYLDEDASPEHPIDSGGGNTATVDNKLDEDASPEHPIDSGGGNAVTVDNNLDEDASPDHPIDSGGGSLLAGYDWTDPGNESNAHCGG